MIAIPIVISGSVIGLKICAIITGIKKCKSIIKKKKKKHGKIVLLPKSKLKSMEVLSPKASMELLISHDEFILINNVLKEYKKMKEEIKNLVCPLDLACVAKVSDVIYKSYRIA